MMSRIDRIRRAALVRRAQKAEADSVDGAQASGANLPIPVGPVTGPRTFRDDRRSDSEFAAQLMGQSGERRGLRAGASLLDLARNSYNRTEWSGSYDRRARKGRRTRTEI